MDFRGCTIKRYQKYLFIRPDKMGPNCHWILKFDLGTGTFWLQLYEMQTTLFDKFKISSWHCLQRRVSFRHDSDSVRGDSWKPTSMAGNQAKQCETHQRFDSKITKEILRRWPSVVSTENAVTCTCDPRPIRRDGQ